MSKRYSDSYSGNSGGVSHTDYRAYEEFESSDEEVECEQCGQVLPEHMIVDGLCDECREE